MASPLPQFNRTAGTQITAEKGKMCSEQKLLSGSKLESVHAGLAGEGEGGDQQPNRLSRKSEFI